MNRTFLGSAITATGLSKTYGADVTALAGSSFQVDYGEIYSLLGRNGSGKTTTVRLLTTLSAPTGGTAIVAGHDVVRDPRAVRRSVGVTMQAAALDPLMTGREHLELVLGAWGRRATARPDADALIEDFGLADAGDRLIGTYSGGMQRRLDLAGAMAHRPAILFLDEPTTGLDAQSRRALWERVRAMRDDGTAVFLTTQYLEEADVLADTVAVLDRGRLIAQGTPAELKARHSTSSVRVRVGDTAALASRMAATSKVEPDGWVRIDLTAGQDAIGVIDRIRAEAFEVHELAVVPPSLEDAFLSLTGVAVNPISASDLKEHAA